MHIAPLDFILWHIWLRVVSTKRKQFVGYYIFMVEVLERFFCTIMFM